ncbi:MAG TPA: carboxypeptidase-like regulatory domain-containing protein [Gemmatimonadaceae bacterium]|nr:carboxypeptidase-like regulatory domain-containing protein [Gemmatimonadaceae bacterium]
MRPTIAAALGLSLVVTPLDARGQAVGSLQGTLREQVGTRSVRSASISLMRVESESSPTINARPDEQGQFRLDSLAPGRYLVQVSSPTLDSLELSLPPERIEIAAGKASRLDFTLPSGVKLRDAVCQGLRLSEGKVVVAGRALNADTDKPLPGAEVVAAWVHNFIDKKTLQIVTQQRHASVKAGPDGGYRMCGVPSGETLSLQLQYAGRAGTVVRVAITDEEGAVVRDLSLSPTTSPTQAALDSVARVLSVDGRDTTREELKLVGTASLTGAVRSLSGEAVADAEVRVRDARSATVTDSAGRFTLTALPAGTQLLMVRKLGYPLAETVVELRADRSATHDVLLRRNVVLDSVRVVSSRVENTEFERNRRTHAFGQFVTSEDIEKMHASETADLFINVLGFTVFGHGSQARILSNSALARHPQCRSATVVVDGLEGATLNSVAPSQIAGIEAYADETFVPARFAGRSECGVIVIWLRKAPKRAMQPMGLSGNGYP